LSAVNENDGRLRFDGNNWNDDNRSYAFGIALLTKINFIMKTYKNLYHKIYEWENLVLAFKKARKGKTKKSYVAEFQENAIDNLEQLQFELMSMTYNPKPHETFILRDPKTRKISKSDFRDRIVHHALCNIIGSIFQKSFIYDSCANQKGKGNLFAIKRFDKFLRKVSENGKTNGWFDKNQIKGYCLKSDVKHYFEEVNHDVLLMIIKRKIADEKVICLIKQILKNVSIGRGRTSFCNKGMPLGNLTSQFFANVYLNELDYFIKHKLKAKYYIRYVDDFVILHKSKEQLEKWKEGIDKFLKGRLGLELHPQKSKIISLSKGIDLVGFRNFYYFKLLRKRNIRKMLTKITLYREKRISKERLLDSFQGWNAYARWADSLNLRRMVVKKIYNFNK